MQGSVLIVEDDPALQHSLQIALSALGLRAKAVSNGEAALHEVRAQAFDVILLDLNMPGMGGMLACRALREAEPTLSIIVLTVRDAGDDKIQALDAGADDYVTKPFHLPELLARIKAALRRSQVQASGEERPIQIGEITLFPAQRRVRRGENEIHLTPKEFELLLELMSHAGRPISHRALLTSVWGPEYGDEREYLRTYINQLRRKLEAVPSQPVYLLTENYVGYRFQAAGSESLMPS